MAINNFLYNLIVKNKKYFKIYFKMRKYFKRILTAITFLHIP